MVDYPAHLARERRLADGREVLVRPVRAEDEQAERAFFSHLSTETKRLRFMKCVGRLGEKLIHDFTHVDYQNHMGFVCEARVDGRLEVVGDARYFANPDGRSCELGIVIADGWHGTGIAGLLMDALIRAARARRFETMEGLVLRDNADMLRFVRALGFEVVYEADDHRTVRIVKRL